jgi:hypothetical protein
MMRRGELPPGDGCQAMPLGTSIPHLGGGYHYSGSPQFVPGGLPSSKFFLANGDALYGDYGHQGAANAAQCSQNAAATVSAIRLPRLPCTRDLETNPNPHPPRIVNQMAASHIAGPVASQPAHAHAGGMTYTQGSYQHPVSHAAPAAAPMSYGGYGGANMNASRGHYGQGSQTGNVGYEIKPIPGVRYPRTSIGAGHPAGPLAEVVPVRYRGDCVDLSPLLPCTYPPQQFVLNAEDNDRYHRTSVYAASGLPIDMAAYASPGAWKERVQHQRP